VGLCYDAQHLKKLIKIREKRSKINLGGIFAIQAAKRGII